MKMYDKIYEKWWMKYIVFPLLVGVVLIVIALLLGPGVSIDNSNSVSSPVLYESPNSTVNYLEGKDALLREYLHVASLNAVGASFFAGRGLTNKNELLHGAYIEREDKIQYKCDEDSLKIYRNVIQENPKFPFSYFALGTCLKDTSKSGWEEYLIEAKKILRMTTQIEGHDSHHDQVLEVIQKDLVN